MDSITSDTPNVKSRLSSRDLSRVSSSRASNERASATGLFSTGNATVDAVGQMHFEGNIIDHRWLMAPELRYSNGKVNLPAVILLADIVYWHRPTFLRDEVTNQLTQVRKKFSGEAFYKDYQQWGDALGLTRRQVKEAVAFLTGAGVIGREARPITLASGVRTNNIPIITLNATALAALTYGTNPDADAKPSAKTVAAPPKATKNTTTRALSTATKPAEKEAAKLLRQRQAPDVITSHRPPETQRRDVITSDPRQQNVTPPTPQRQAPHVITGDYSTESTTENFKDHQQHKTPAALREAAAPPDVDEFEKSLTASPKNAETNSEPNDQANQESSETGELVEKLHEAGMSRKQATMMATSACDMAWRQLEWLPYHLQDQESKKRPVKNVGGFLRRAIEEGYPMPQTLAKQQETAHNEAQRRHQLDQEAQERANARDRRAQAERENAEVEEYFCSLDKTSQQTIEEQARRRCSGMIGLGINPTSALDAERRNIVRRELGMDSAASYEG